MGWPQEHVDAVFYSMVCDLAGAPKELINPTTGEVVGYATYTLFGKRHWAGTVNTPLLFAGQYEDTESGWVYNRFRYYDPHAGVYNAQDPLGLLANLGTAQGYVTNPVTWVDVLGLKKCKPYLQNSTSAIQKKVNNVIDSMTDTIAVDRNTMAIANIEMVFKNGATDAFKVATTNNLHNRMMKRPFRLFLPNDVYDIRAISETGIVGIGVHAEEGIVGWYKMVESKLSAGEIYKLTKEVSLQNGGKITKELILDPADLEGLRMTDLAASRAVCPEICEPKLQELDSMMFERMELQEQYLRRVEVFNLEVEALKTTDQMALNNFRSLHVPTPLEKLMTPEQLRKNN